ncbi:MAG: zinc ribbon domain-containing protein [Ruminococcus sp.]|nr:zinc ribbon domain-containing protein [Ruminococcus sp.]
MSDIFKKIGDTITETGKTVGEKTKQVSSVAKFNAKIISSEHSISDNYTILGKYYYDTYKDNPAEEVAETVNSITASLETIADMKSQILAIKGMVKCQDCGAECPFDDTFCGKCGAKLEKPEPPVEEEAPAEEEVIEAIEEADQDVTEE